MLAALACAFEIVAANRDVFPESTSVVIWHGGRIRMHISRHGDSRDLNLDERKASAAKVAGRIGLTDDRGNGLSFSNPDGTLSVFTVADGPNHIDRALAEQREGIANQLDEYADQLLRKRDRMISADRPRRASALEEAAGAARHSATVAREFRLEVES